MPWGTRLGGWWRWIAGSWSALGLCPMGNGALGGGWWGGAGAGWACRGPRWGCRRAVAEPAGWWCGRAEDGAGLGRGWGLALPLEEEGQQLAAWVRALRAVVGLNLEDPPVGVDETVLGSGQGPGCGWSQGSHARRPGRGPQLCRVWEESPTRVLGAQTSQCRASTRGS